MIMLLIINKIQFYYEKQYTCLLLPEKLRTFATIDKKVVLIGQLNKFELWNEDAWAAKESEWLDGDDNEGLEDLGSLSF